MNPLRNTAASLKSRILLFLIFCTLGTNHAARAEVAKTAQKVISIQNLLHRSKRNVADVIVTDRFSRRQTHHLRHSYLSKLLTILDTASNGGKCACFLRTRGYQGGSCHCNPQTLLLTLQNKLTSASSSSRNAIDRLFASLDRTTKKQMLRLAFEKLHRSIRARAIEKHRTRQKFKRFLRKRHTRRHYPRAAFDRLALLSF